MNRRKSIYKGFNKRRKNKEIKAIIVVVAICIAGGYSYTKIKDSDMFKNFSQYISLDGLSDMLKKYISISGNYSAKHLQLLYTYGFILRFIAALLASYYLRYNNKKDIKILDKAYLSQLSEIG